MNKAMDINCDVGESYGKYSFGADDEIIPLLSSANIACGFHAGDPVHMERTVALAKEHNVAIGVHWGLPDVIGFGRRKMDISEEEARCMTLYQIGALSAFVKAAGAEIDHVMPHGALYSMLASNEKIARGMLSAISSISRDWVFYHPTPLEKHAFFNMAAAEGYTVIPEVSIDSHYNSDGTVVIGPAKHGWDMHELEDRVQRIIESGRLGTIDGKEIEFDVKAISFHGDGPNAAQVARMINSVYKRLGIEVSAGSKLAGKSAPGRNRSAVETH